MKSSPTAPPPSEEDRVREHVFDGIEEYDKRLPNWWLWTLFGAIAFSVVYWVYYHYPRQRFSDGEQVDREMARIALAAQNAGAALTDEQLWTMSRDAGIIASGKATFASTCASCHGENLEGKIGPNLVDNKWRHGGKPVEVFKVVNQGALEKGMPAWGPVLGGAKVAEVTAFLMSFHEADAPVEKEEVQ